MAIISRDKAREAPPGNDTGLSFNLSNQRETWQRSGRRRRRRLAH